MKKETLDLQGLVCPYPIIKVSRFVEETSSLPDFLEVLVDDPGAPSDFQYWSKTHGYTIERVEKEGRITRILIKLKT